MKSLRHYKKIASYTTEVQCPDCGSKRYKKIILSSKIMGYSIADFNALQLDELVKLIKNINDDRVGPIINNLTERLNDLIEIGLDYVSLDRETSTLSGGESQRVKMVKHLTNSLTVAMYIVDGASIGLYPICPILQVF